MSGGGLSRSRLGRLHDVMAGYVERGEVPGIDSHGWGFGLSMVTRRVDVAGPVGQFGWDGGLGTSWRSDPKEEMVAILMTQRAWTSPDPPGVCRDFWTSAYQAIAD